MNSLRFWKRRVYDVEYSAEYLSVLNPRNSPTLKGNNLPFLAHLTVILDSVLSTVIDPSSLE